MFSRPSDAGPSRLALYDRDEDGFPCHCLPTDADARCENCGEMADELTYLPGWDFRACPACVAENAAALAENLAEVPGAPDYWAIALDAIRAEAARLTRKPAGREAGRKAEGVA